MMRLTVALAFFAALLPQSVNAETAYVTDQLRLGLHRAEDTSDRAFRTLQSGQQLEIVSQTRNYAQVRLPDGTAGYVKAAYLVTDKPAALIVAEMRSENQRLQGELEAKIAQFAGPAATISALEQQVAEQNATIEENALRVAELAAQNEHLGSRQEQYKNSLPVSWVLGATSICLLAGFLGGMWWIDHRSRKRHGGFRI
ncbi:MAG: TIGR04211 family SH3 domain-containing protein [Woeseia sp.]